MKCLYYCFLFLDIAILSVPVKSQTCTSFKHIFVQFKDISGENFNITIEGCIERIKFNDAQTVTEALIRKQNDVIRLGKDSVRNMIRLSRISFVGCNSLEIIEPGSFRNVPALEKVQITFCKLRKVQKGNKYHFYIYSRWPNY